MAPFDTGKIVWKADAARFAYETIGGVMKQLLFVSFAGVISISLVACGTSDGAPSAEVRQNKLIGEVELAEASLLRAMLEKDPEAAAAHYTEDAVVSLANEPAITGRGAIADDFRIGLPPLISNETQRERIEIAGSGEIAYIQGRFRSTYTNIETNRRETLTGTYLTVYKRQPDQTWKITQDISSADGPPTDGNLQ
jgi:ketosteroid isomerase-like protein